MKDLPFRDIVVTLVAFLILTALFTEPAAASSCDTHVREACHVVDDVVVFKVDVMAADYDFEVVLGNDGGELQGLTEHIRDMVAREPYLSRLPVLAFPADYFGLGGPEGLTVKNGMRLANGGANNNTEFWRSSFSIGADRTMRIGRQRDCPVSAAFGCSVPPDDPRCGEPGACMRWIPDPDRYDQTFGGGPLFIRDGQALQSFAGDTAPCNAEQINPAFCTNLFEWTAIGMNREGNTMIVAVAGEDAKKTMYQMSAILLAEGAWTAMKLEGGGGTQLWYRGEELVQSSDEPDRPLGIAFVIFESAAHCVSFCDVRYDNPRYLEIKVLKDRGISNGNSTGYFLPAEPIKQAEFATMLWRWLDEHVPVQSCLTPDSYLPTVDSPHRESIRQLICHGIWETPVDGAAITEAELTYEQALELLIRALRLLLPARISLYQDQQYTKQSSPLSAAQLAVDIGVAATLPALSDTLSSSLDRGSAALLLVRAMAYASYHQEYLPHTIPELQALLQRPINGRPSPMIWGDASCSGAIDTNDRQVILKHDLGLTTMNFLCVDHGQVYRPACDVDLNGLCNVLDALRIAQCASSADRIGCPR